MLRVSRTDEDQDFGVLRIGSNREGPPARPSAWLVWDRVGESQNPLGDDMGSNGEGPETGQGPRRSSQLTIFLLTVADSQPHSLTGCHQKCSSVVH